MVKELHGKHYYIELEYYQLVIEAQRLISEDNVLKNETFTLSKMDNGHWVIFTDETCGNFRGPKYRSWERFKRNIYKIKKES